MSRPDSGSATGPLSPAAVHRTLLRDLVEDLARTDRQRLSASGVHLTRKRIKRARAALALLRPALDEPDFDACDQSLRDAGRSLATARDSTVMAQTYARMRARTATGSPHHVSRPAKARTPVDGRAGRTVDSTVAHRHLLAAVQRLGRIRITARGWTPLGSGVRAVYRRGRRRRPTQSHPPTEDLHAWRRHAKRYWHVLELFETVNPERIAPHVADARRLSDVLGEEHDLALLAERLRSRQARADRAVLATVAERRAKLTRRALKLGGKVYGEPARVIERRLRADWERWRKAR